MQTHIKHPSIMFSKKEDVDERQTNIIKAKMWRNPVSATLETYKLNTKIFENGQPEELITLLNNFNKATKGTGTTAVDRRINYLRTMLHEEALL